MQRLKVPLGCIDDLEHRGASGNQAFESMFHGRDVADACGVNNGVQRQAGGIPDNLIDVIEGDLPLVTDKQTQFLNFATGGHAIVAEKFNQCLAGRRIGGQPAGIQLFIYHCLQRARLILIADLAGEEAVQRGEVAAQEAVPGGTVPLAPGPQELGVIEHSR